MKLKRVNQACPAENRELGISPLLSYGDVAKITGKSIQTLRRYQVLGTGPRALKIGRHIRFSRESVIAWLSSCSREAA